MLATKLSTTNGSISKKGGFVELKRSRNEGIEKQIAVNLNFEGFSRFAPLLNKEGSLFESRQKSSIQTIKDIQMKTKMKKPYLIHIILFFSLLSLTSQAMVPDLGDENCDSLILVSDWNSNNVKIFDGCSGIFVRDLDSQSLIDGPLGILQAPDGDILLVSENNKRLLKFDYQTLSSGSVIMGDDPNTTPVENTFIEGPSGAVIDSDGFMYAASYTQNSVVKINTETWQIVDQMLAANNGQITGIDAGITIGDGHLYLPGYDSNNIIKINLSTKAVSEVVARNAGGLSTPRTILLKADELWVTAERENAVMVFDLTSGEFKQTLVEIAGPTGMQEDGDNHFLVNTPDAVFRVFNDISSFEKVVLNGAGGMSSGTFVYRLYKTDFDSDNDGLTDDEETNVYGTDPEDPDSDDDNLSDGDEVNIHQTNPLLADTDNDGMPDDFEVNYGLAATVDDAADDLDSDDLSNIEEYLAGTLPNNEDTDGDGENDGVDSDPLVPNSAPEINGIPITIIDQDASYQFLPTVSYVGDISTVSLDIENKPDWAEFDQTSGELTGQPTNSDVGVFSAIAISATNGFHIVPLDSFEIEVLNVNDAPTLDQAIPNQSLNVDQTISLDTSIYFSDIDQGDSLTFGALGLPAGINIDEQGLITGSASTEGNSTINVTVTDNSSATATGSFSLSVQEDGGGNDSGGGSLAFLLFGLMFLHRNNK